MKFINLKSTTMLIFVLVLVALMSAQAFASAGGANPHAQQKKLQPATRYNGRSPVDLSNGIPFNNGTFGVSNEAYEKWAKEPALVPGISEVSYGYSDKDSFVASLEENARFVDAAIKNWKSTTANTKPEAKEYGEKSAAAMQPLLDRFKDSISAANRAGRGDWDKAQSDARRSLAEMRGTYSSLHRNVR